MSGAVSYSPDQHSVTIIRHHRLLITARCLRYVATDECPARGKKRWRAEATEMARYALLGKEPVADLCKRMAMAPTRGVPDMRCATRDEYKS